MANQFPAALNNYTGAETDSDAGHAQAHNAVETKLGIDSSVVTTSIDYLLKNVSSIDPGHHHTNATLDSIASSKVTGLPTFPSGTIVGNTDTQTLTNKTLTQPILTPQANPNPTTSGKMAWNSSTNAFQIGDGSNTHNFVDQDQSQSMSNKTLITPIIKTEFANGNSGATFTINWANGDRQNIVISASTTLSFSNASAGQTLTLWLVENGTGNFTITLPTIKWYPAAPAFTTTANAVNSITVRYDGTNYYGQGAVGYA